MLQVNKTSKKYLQHIVSVKDYELKQNFQIVSVNFSKFYFAIIFLREIKENVYKTSIND